ncbi:MAG: spinster family MFS transporter, partial [Hyphomonadaceae bacterium]
MAAEGAEQSAAVAAGAAAPKLYSKSQTGWMLFVLAALLANSFSDRAILAILAQPIMTELRITDTQFGVLTGLAFATFYAIFGYPIAHLAGRFGRINIITICALLWSAMAAGCGMALNYFQLALFRFGVGIGESGMAAPGQAIISDYVPPERRTSSIALFQMGPPLGVMAGSVAGGWLAQHFGWRTAFVIVALPGFLLAPLLKLTVREPPQGNWDASRLAGGAPKAAPSLLRVLAKLYSTSTMRHMTAGTVIAIFANSGAAFLGAYYVRRFGLDYTTLGLIIGIMGGVAGVTGVLMGGFLTDWFAKWSKRWYALLPTFALLAAAPLFVLAYLQADWRIQSAFMIVSSALLAIAPIPFYGVTLYLVPGPLRAPAAA